MNSVKSNLGATRLQILRNLAAQVGLRDFVGILIFVIGILIFSINANRGIRLWILPPGHPTKSVSQLKTTIKRQDGKTVLATHFGEL